MAVTDVSLRWRWARVLEAADGGVSAATTLPGSGLGGAARGGSAALPEEAGAQRVPAWEGREDGPGGWNLDCGQGRAERVLSIERHLPSCAGEARVPCGCIDVSSSSSVSHSAPPFFCLYCLFFFFFHFCIKKKTLFSMSFCLSFFLFTLQLRTPSPRTVTI